MKMQLDVMANRVNQASNRVNNQVNNQASNPDGNKASSKVNNRDNRVDSKVDRRHSNKADNSKAVRRMVVHKMELATHDSTVDQPGDRKETVGETIVKSDPNGDNDSAKQKTFVENGAVAQQPELLANWMK